MDFSYLFYALGNNAFFTSRTFLPALITALVIKYPDLVFMLDSAPITGDELWLVKDEVILGLAFLSFFEELAIRNPEFARFIEEIDSFIKFAALLAVNNAMVDPMVLEAVFKIDEPSMLASTVTGVAVSTPIFFLTRMRKSFLGYVRDLDEDNDLGLITLANWMENGWVFFGVFFLIVFPIFSFFMILIVLGIIFLIEQYLKKKEEQSKIECSNCKELILPSAANCFSCGTANDRARNVGLLGFPKDSDVRGIDAHKYQLMAAKRCPNCATRKVDRNFDSKCETCNKLPKDLGVDAKIYNETIEGRLKDVLIASLIFGLFPIIGIIATIIYSKFKLAKPYKQFTGFGKRFFVKLVTLFGIIVLIIIQPIPIVGAITCPIIALMYYYAWKAGFEEQYGIVK
jgi:hypothetical protein